jgi:hypothetical protein
MASQNTIFAKTFLAFNQLGKNVVFKSKKNLAKKRRRKMGSGRFVTSKIDNTGRLSSSIKFKSSGEDSYFEMNEYGLYVDEGRKPGKYAPVKPIQSWVKSKPVLPRDERGRFMKRTPSAMKSLAFLINRGIFKYGIEPTNFFSDPLKEEEKLLFKKLPDMIEADLQVFFNR